VSEPTVEPRLVFEAVDKLCDIVGVSPESIKMFPQSNLDEAIESVVDVQDGDHLRAYVDPVLDQLNASEHPHRDGMYLTETAREEYTIYADMDKSERIVLLRRWAVMEALHDRKRQDAWEYSEAIELFEDNAGGGGPSHDYVYDLMEAAADEPGFKYGQFSVGTQTPRKLLRVDVSEVNESILDWCRNEYDLDPELIGVIADIDQYGAGSPPDQEVGADD